MDLLQLILFILPAYFANSTPVISGGRTPIDLGAKLGDRQRLLGPGKTFRGLAVGIVAGTIAGAVMAYLIPALYLAGTGQGQKILIAFALSVGTMLGDSIGSFIKRRRKLKPGQETVITDKLTFLIVALLVAYPFYGQTVNLQIIDLVFLAVLTVVLHKAFNWLAHSAKLKKVAW